MDSIPYDTGGFLVVHRLFPRKEESTLKYNSPAGELILDSPLYDTDACAGVGLSSIKQSMTRVYR